jgi:ABC-type dipeptide/oligopeptide/nickel transport system ATPase component
MIISLRGTSGSGKSHLVRSVTELYEKHRDVYTGGRVKPYYTFHGRNPKGRVLVTPGHYEIKNGGIDTLDKLDDAYHIARWATKCGHDVLMEGKNMSDGLVRVNELMAGKFDIRLVFIEESLDTCIAGVRARGHKIAEASIEKTLKKVMRDMKRFSGKMFVGNREQCFKTVKEWLGW